MKHYQHPVGNTVFERTHQVQSVNPGSTIIEKKLHFIPRMNDCINNHTHIVSNKLQVKSPLKTFTCGKKEGISTPTSNSITPSINNQKDYGQLIGGGEPTTAQTGTVNLSNYTHGVGGLGKYQEPEYLNGTIS